MDPPDPMPNSVVKRNSADGSVGSPHVRVGHRQAPNTESPLVSAGFYFAPAGCNVSEVKRRFSLFNQLDWLLKKDENFVLTGNQKSVLYAS